MAKETFYFSHDYGARNDPKLIKVLMKLGQAGKGVYWDLVEMMYEQNGFLLLSECESYAFALRTDCDTITKLINDFELFEKDDKKFWSNSVLSRLKQRDEKSNKAKKSALARWNNANNQQVNANALQTECESNAIKERKGKENKEKESKVNEINDSVNASLQTQKFDFKTELLKFGVDENYLNDWMSLRNKKDWTESVFKFFINQVEESKITVNEAVKICAQNSWKGFRKSYYENLKKSYNGKQQNTNNAKESVAELGKIADAILANAGQNNTTNHIF